MTTLESYLGMAYLKHSQNPQLFQFDLRKVTEAEDEEEWHDYA